MLLAVDTSSAQIGLGLYDGVQVRAEILWLSQQHHTIELAPALADMMSRVGVRMDEVQTIAVAIGPGSFTALRVGLAFVKGLALSRKMALVGVPTLDILAAGQPAARTPLVAVLQAGRGRLAMQRYNPVDGPRPEESAWASDGPAEIITADALADSIEKPTLVAGELSASERQRLMRKKVNIILASPA
ncbi:MAG TPA: tRNA (adenosine(37)-N6)-threonylcarbamoyltransferase complex dimerization subunit type 1 TsaB, partial [Anaerolineales bacterium]|nr:tRNA (adenosine(37)-N6)-threonylcarbamoyltransferase complex dimerization subunit type 1 TsaB [Anaerolineales bacterium]